jgi:hypothetical protein
MNYQARDGSSRLGDDVQRWVRWFKAGLPSYWVGGTLNTDSNDTCVASYGVWQPVNWSITDDGQHQQ